MSPRLLGNIVYALGLTLWVMLSLIIGQLLASLIVFAVPSGVNESVLTTMVAALGYALGLTLAIGGPALFTKKLVSKKTIGFDRLPSFTDIGFGILSVLPYYLLSAILLWVGMEVLNIIDPNVGQQIPFDNLTLRVEYVVAFLTLVVIAPLAEELLFRGYFLGCLGERIGKWIAVFITAAAFGFMHLLGFSDTGLNLQWAAAMDTFAMGLVVGVLRNLTGSIWAGVILHLIKNGIAYYFLFINPLPPTGM